MKKSGLILAFMLALIMVVATACTTPPTSGGGGSNEIPDSENQEGKEFSIVFQNYDGSLLSTVTVEEGKPIVYDGELPAKTKEGYTCRFVGWTDGKNGTVTSLPLATADTIYVAVFEEKINTYAVTWKMPDGTLLDKDVSVPYGTTPEYSGKQPTKSEVGKVYTFIGWSTSASATQAEVLEAIKDNTVYYAVFTTNPNKYTVTWVVNGATVETDENVPHGSIPVYNGKTPTKPETEQYTYVYSGWSPEISAVTKDVVYTATFVEKLKTYSVTWVNWDGSVIYQEDVALGSTPKYSGELPTKTEGGEKFEFFAWSPNLSAASGDAVYTANFIEKDIEYSDFGAVGNGSADDFEALYKAHAYANATGAYSVVAQSGKTYYIHNTVPSESLIEWVNGIIDNTHSTSSNSQCIYGANENHVNANGLPTDCHGNLVTDGLKSWAEDKLSSLKRGRAVAIPVQTNVVWTNAKFTIDDTDIVPLTISGTTASAPTDKQYSTHIFSVTADGYEINEALSSTEYSASIAETMNNADFNSLLSSKTYLKALNEQIQKEGIGPDTSKLNINPGYPATVIIYNESLATEATRTIAGKSKTVDNQNVYIRYGGNANSGAAKRETILIDANGNVDPSTPIMFDYTRIVQVVICNMEIPELKIKGGEFTTLACREDVLFSVNSDGTKDVTGTAYKGAYINRGLQVKRSNVTIEGVKHYIENELTLADYANGLHGAHYNGFFNVTSCGNVTLDSCVMTGRRNYGVSGSYDFSASTVCGIYLKNCTQTNFWITESASGQVLAASRNDANAKLGMENSPTYGIQILWGVGGSNWCKNMEYYSCTLSRFDAHQGLYNGKIVDSTVTLISVIGMGDLYVENTEILCARPSANGNCVINLRDDYGSVWKGDIYISNVRAASMAKSFAIAYYKYNNHDFGYDCYLPNIHVDDFTLTNADYVTSLYLFGTSGDMTYYTHSMHLPVLSNGDTNVNVITMPQIFEIDDIFKYDYIISHRYAGQSFSEMSIPVKVTVNYKKPDGSILGTEIYTFDFNEIYTVTAKAYSGYVASLDSVSGCIAEDSKTVIDIYYSAVNAWDGTSVSTSLSGSGTKDSPYLITSGADLAWIRDNMDAKESFSGKFFKMTANIDLGGNHLMIGSYGNTTNMKAFAGTFDGNGYCILNLAVNDTTNDKSGTGLFAVVYKGAVKNLTVHGTVTSVDSMTGGIVGRLDNATLTNCTGFVTVNSTYADTGNYGTGGLIGFAQGANNTTVTNCVNYGAVVGNCQVGGISGVATGTFTGCANFGAVTGTASTDGKVGGISGVATGTITECVNYGYIKGITLAGGIVGSQSDGSVENCSNYGTVSGTNHVAGIVGGALWAENSSKTITNCKNVGTVMNSGYFGAGICGAGDQLTISGCSNYGTVGGTGDCAGGIIAAAYAGTTVSSCSNMGLVKGKTNLGGIAFKNEGTVKSCTNYGRFTLTTTTGTVAADGVVHTNNGTVSSCKNYGGAIE